MGEVEIMIPSIIHQIWIEPRSGYGLLPQEVLDRKTLWMDLHPEFDYRLWSARDILDELITDTDVLKAISACRFPAMKADLARLFLLEKHGGFYVDLKLSPRMRFLNEYRDYKTLFIEHHPSPKLSSALNFLTNSFIGSQPSQLAIQQILSLAVRAVTERRTGNVFDITGPRVLNEYLKKVLEKDGSAKDVFVIRQHIAWNKYLSIGSAPYNVQGQHWSERQRDESLYEA